MLTKLLVKYSYGAKREIHRDAMVDIDISESRLREAVIKVNSDAHGWLPRIDSVSAVEKPVAISPTAPNTNKGKRNCSTCLYSGCQHHDAANCSAENHENWKSI